MEKTVIYRKKEEYMADSGEKVEIWTKHGKVLMQANQEEDEQNEQIDKEKLFYGTIMIMTQIGPKEIKFFIPDVDTVEEAFKVFPEATKQVIEELEKQREEAMREAESQIIQAPAGAMNQIDRQMGQMNKNPKIHIP